jgi:hypothetical protein
MQALDDALALLSQPGKAYEQADPSLRKMLNRAIFYRILIQVVDRQVEAEGIPQEVYTQLVQTAKSVGLAPSAVPDVLVEAHQAVLAGPRRGTRFQSSTNKPQPILQESGFARRQDGGERGIRTLGTVTGTLLFESSTFNHSVTSPDISIVPCYLLKNLVFGRLTADEYKAKLQAEEVALR